MHVRNSYNRRIVFSPFNAQKVGNFYGIDALIAQLIGVSIVLTTADCVPILFLNLFKNVIALAHAVWCVTYARIAVKTINSLVDKFNCHFF